MSNRRIDVQTFLNEQPFSGFQSATQAGSFVLTEKTPETQAHSGVDVVLSRPYILGSAMLWLAYFMGLVIFYALINWMPVLFKEAGLPPREATLIAAVFIAGTLMNTAQSSMPSLAAAFYPTKGRATGVAWMLGLGRFGGIAGSFLVAELARRQLGFGDIFGVVAVPGVIAALALLVKLAGNPNRSVDATSRQREALAH